MTKNGNKGEVISLELKNKGEVIYSHLPITVDTSIHKNHVEKVIFASYNLPSIPVRYEHPIFWFVENWLLLPFLGMETLVDYLNLIRIFCKVRSIEHTNNVPKKKVDTATGFHPIRPHNN